MEEGKAKLVASKGKITRKLPVFYNPVMKLNRDITICLLNSIDKEDMQIALPLAGSGVRGFRMMLELNKGKIKNIAFNDYKTAEHIREGLKINNLSAEVYSKDANLFLLESKGFDYIDIDPFGSPNPFLEAAVTRLARDGILAVTATDTAALSGSSPAACKRKYWAKPLRNELMHELGIRILIRKVQLIGAHNEKALLPIFSYSKDHYYRIFFRCEKGKKKVDDLLMLHKYFLYNPKNMDREVSNFNKKTGYQYAGPLWSGRLWDSRLVDKMYNEYVGDKRVLDILSIIKEESKIDVVGFYDLHKYAKLNKKPVPKIETLLKNGKIARTHFLGWGIRSNNNLFN